jgi:hypothetical protein
MLFSNKKEEVIDLELTVHGRRLLSNGVFKPVYYSFYDDNIIYDPQRIAGSTANPNESEVAAAELQNDVQKRIREETPYLKTQGNFSGREVLVEGTNQISERERNYILTSPLGTVNLNSFKSPAWQVSFLHNSSSHFDTAFYNSSKHQLVHIPQVKCEIMYETAVGLDLPPGRKKLPRGFEEDPELNSGVFSDNSYVAVDPDYILLNVEEKNSVFSSKNYDVEIYESGSDGWNKLDFRNKPEQIVNNILVDNPIRPDAPIDSSYVEYFFDVLVDEEIPTNLICKGVQKLKSKKIFVDTEVDCPDLQGSFDINPYISDSPEVECP